MKPVPQMVLATVRSEVRLTSGLRAVCAELDLDPAGARLLRNVNNAVFQLARDPVVIRLVTLPSYVPRARLAVAAATVFARHDVPAIRLLPGVRQPVRAGEHLATVWQSVRPTGPPPGGADLARLLHAVHAVPLPCRALPRWDPLTDFDNRVRHTTAMAAADSDFLLGRSAELAGAVAELRFVLPTAVLHGDAHLGNVIPGPDRAVLCDFDSCAVGPPEWDLTPVAVGTVRFNRPVAHHRDFLDTYGFDVRDWEGFVVLHGIRDLKLIAGVFPRVGSPPVVLRSSTAEWPVCGPTGAPSVGEPPGAEGTPRAGTGGAAGAPDGPAWAVAAAAATANLSTCAGIRGQHIAQLRTVVGQVKLVGHAIDRERRY